MIEFFPLETQLRALTPLWEGISEYLIAKGGTYDIIPTLQEQAQSSTTGKVSGIVLQSNRHPVALGWVERITDCTGNALVYSLHPEFQAPLVKEMVSRGLMDDIFCELFQFEDTEVYREAFRAQGVHENVRQRMGIYLSNVQFSTKTLPQGLGFVPLTIADAPAVAKLSARCHQISRDYVGYKALESEDGRLELEHRIFSGFYGPVIPESAIKLIKDGRMIGMCVAVEIKCWGYEKVPWIFDVCIEEAEMGKGYGRLIVEELLRKLEKSYEVCGLAVTMDNHAARTLYEKLGFMVTDPFYEYVRFTKGAPIHG